MDPLDFSEAVQARARPVVLARLRNERYRERHRAEIRSRHRLWREANPGRWRTICRNGKTRMSNEALLLHCGRARAKRLGVPFELRLVDISIPDRCPVLGLRLERRGGQACDASPTLDRFNPSLGYVPGNVTVISWRANLVKSVGSATEHAKIAAWMRGLQRRK